MDTQSFKQRILPLQPAMQRMAMALLHSEALAEDAVQDAVVELWQQRDKLDKVLNLEAYCITLVKRRSVDLLRRQRPTQPIDEASLLLTQLPPDDTEERYQLALRLIDQLPLRQREALLLKYEQEKSNQQIAHQLHITPNHLGVILHRALQSLKNQMQEPTPHTNIKNVFVKPSTEGKVAFTLPRRDDDC